MRIFAPIAIAVAVAACSQPASDTTTATATDTSVATTTAPASANNITSDGWGPLHVGMTRAEVVAAVGDKANPAGVGGADPEACDLFHPANAPDGLLVMLAHNQLTSITLRNNTGLKTDRGFGVGDTAAAIKTAYGASATSMPHKYSQAPAEYITVWTANGPSGATGYTDNPAARGIRYEIGEDGNVSAVHAGGPTIQNVEGCS